MRTFLLCCGLALVVILLLAGCDTGESHHDVSTDTDGTLDGLVLTPAPQTLAIGLDTEFLLDWEAGTVPPHEFHVTLKEVDPDGSIESVYTYLTTFSTGHYRLSPSMMLPSAQFLLLEVTGAGQTVRAIYLTNNNGANSTAPRTRHGDGEAKAEHVVTWK